MLIKACAEECWFPRLIQVHTDGMALAGRCGSCRGEDLLFQGKDLGLIEFKELRLFRPGETEAACIHTGCQNDDLAHWLLVDDTQQEIIEKTCSDNERGSCINVE